MAKNFFKRYIWLIDLINRRCYISLPDISREWQRSPLNDTGGPLSERTFFNHKAAILDIFGIEIKNDRTLGFYIGGSEGIGSSSTSAWMLHALCLNNVMQENADMKDRILVENAPSGEKYLVEVISAMRSSKVISLTYKGFTRALAHTFPTRPYCVKYFKQRWYMLGRSDLGLRVYALDRFEDMEELDETFELPDDFNAETFFDNYFGIITGDEPKDILLKVEPSQAQYFRTLPLHHSQKEEECIDGWPVFSYRLAPTFDFVQELLSHGPNVEVLAPEGLRKHLAGIIREMNALYDRQ